MNHPYINRVLAVCVDQSPKLYIISQSGLISLQSFLHSKEKNADYSALTTYKEKLKLCSRIVSGLQYLHEKGIAHLHLSNTNILIDKNQIPKITDYGFTKTKELASMFLKYRNKNSYTSPELFQINSSISNSYKSLIDKFATHKYKTYVSSFQPSTSMKLKKLDENVEKDEDNESNSSQLELPFQLDLPTNITNSKSPISKQEYYSHLNIDEAILYKSDIYSLGLLIWEVFSEVPPFTTSLKEVYKHVVVDHLRPEIIKEKIPHQIAALIKKCWSHDYTKRPTINDVIQEISMIEL